MLLNYSEIEGTDFTVIDMFQEEMDIEEFIDSCKLKFKKEKNKGVIRNCEFEDNEWILHDGKVSSKIKFKMDEVTYKRFDQEMPYKVFMELYKSYIVGLLRTMAIESLIDVANNIHWIAEDSEFLRLDYVDSILKKATNQIETGSRLFEKSLDFFKLIPGQEISEFIDEVSDHIKHSNITISSRMVANRRELPDYYSILLFGKIIEDWWESEISIEERVYFYPVYLWWKITTILPLRPTEFTLIPYDCTEEKDDEFYITVRRSDIKGRGGSFKKIYSTSNTSKMPSYDIDKDYKKMTYKINREIYELLEVYKEMASLDKFKNKFCKEKNVLLNNIMHMHYAHLYYGRNVGGVCLDENRYVFRISTLEGLVHKFYKDIITETYGLKLRDYNISDQELYSLRSIDLEEISRLKPGDTRHIALINMCLSDINPVLIREFVNHRNINTTYHYIENTKQFVKCATHMQYRKLKRDTTSSRINLCLDSNFNVNTLLNKSKKYVSVDDGKCYSKNFIKGSIKDCIVSEIDIGSCRGCKFFLQDTALSEDDIEVILQEFDNKLEKESKFLVSELKRFVSSKNLEAKEDIEIGIMRFKTAVMQHRKVVESVIMEGGNGE